MNVRAFLLLTSIALILSSPTGSAAPGSPMEPVVDFEQFQGWIRLSVTTDGKLVSYALPRTAGGVRQIVLLVAPEAPLPDPGDRLESDDEAPEEPERLPPCPADESGPGLALYRVDRYATPSVTLIRGDLPNDCEATDTADVDADGLDDLLLASEGALYVVDPQGSRRVVDDPGLAWSRLHPRAVDQPELDGRALATATPLGRLILFGPGEDGGDWKRLAEAELPVVGIVGGTALTVRNAIPRFIGVRVDGALLFATQPEEFGKQRLGVSLITIAPGQDAEVTECWARLPEPEEVLEEHFLMIDGRPMLLVTTKPADKLNLFGEKRLRLFTLERDRSRLGRPPVFAAESRMNIWQEANPLLLDVNADGREDLVIGYWKGLKDDKVVLDAYLGQAEGWFAASPQTTGFNVLPAKRLGEGESKPKRPDPDRSFLEYGRDLDGDTIPDLLLRTPAGLMVYRGLASDDGAKLLDRIALELPFDTVQDPGDYVVQFSSEGFESWAVGVRGQPRLADVDGDGASEILIVRRGHGAAPDVLEILGLTSEAP